MATFELFIVGMAIPAYEIAIELSILGGKLLYACYLFAAGTYGIKHSKDINKAGVLRALSAIGLFLSAMVVIFLLVFDAWWLFTEIRDVLVSFAIIGFVFSIMQFIGATKNLKSSTMP